MCISLAYLQVINLCVSTAVLFIFVLMLSIDCDQAVGLRSAVRWFLESGVTDVETNYKSILPLNINPKHLPLNNTELYLNRGNL